ncbi:hypothetical protein F5Y18DRAFT_440103 [Xylariaceae sp. FL1019]|nr:hypothetical protein F5Y18DRAFT_440103 [Xylariaceae sp. FL1019]
MEAVGAGANVIAFVVLAAQLTKTVYTTFSLIKDGPTNLQSVAKDVLGLHETLELLNGCPMVAHDASLPSLIMDCILDLKPIDDNIRHLRITPGEEKIGRLWKRFKIFLDEKKLDQIRTQVHAHTNALHIRLGILQSISIYGISTDMRSLSQSVVDIGDKINHYSSSHVSNITTMHQSFRSLQQSYGHALQGGLSSIESAVQNMESLGQSNANSMLTLLHELKDLIINRNERQPRERQAVGIVEEENAPKNNLPGNPDVEDTLISSITRLCGLIQEKNRVFNTDTDSNEQAEDIMGDIEKMVFSAQQQIEATNGETKIRTDLRRFRQAFGQFELTLNPDRDQTDSPDPNFSWRHEYTTFSLGRLGTIGLMKGTRIRSTSQDKHDDPTCALDSADCKLTVTFLPNNRTQFNMLVASTVRQIAFGRTIHSISSLAVNRVLPCTSKVFQVVDRGEVQDLEEMLRRGEASLRDHDEYGASLLFYSTRNPDMCRFLLLHGADVDHVGEEHGVRQMQQPDELTRSWPISILNALVRCRHRGGYRINAKFAQMLLEAGADPLLSPISDGDNFIANVMTYGSLETFTAFWRWTRSQTFNFANRAFKYGYTPLMVLCQNISQSDSVQKLSILLEAGADVAVRLADGRSCLHVLTQSLIPDIRSIRIARDIIRCLVENGADIDARDNTGKTAQELAYNKCHTFDIDRRRLVHHAGSFAGDLWDLVRHECGHDIRQFRQGHQRRVMYCEQYTRQIFEEMWEGRESDCPYWNDAPWPPEAPWRPFVDDPYRNHHCDTCYPQLCNRDDCDGCSRRRGFFYHAGKRAEALMVNRERDIDSDSHSFITEEHVSSALYENPWRD